MGTNPQNSQRILQIRQDLEGRITKHGLVMACYEVSAVDMPRIQDGTCLSTEPVDVACVTCKIFPGEVLDVVVIKVDASGVLCELGDFPVFIAGESR